MIKLQCKCGHTLKLPAKLAGQKIRCKRCNKVMRVPGDSAPASAPIDSSSPELLVQGSRNCPGCGRHYPPAVVVCVNCGMNIETGAMLYASVEESRPDMRHPAEQEQEQAPLGFFARLKRKLFG